MVSEWPTVRIGSPSPSGRLSGLHRTARPAVGLAVVKARRHIALLAVLVLMVAACSGSDDAGSTTTTASSTTSTSSAPTSTDASATSTSTTGAPDESTTTTTTQAVTTTTVIEDPVVFGPTIAMVQVVFGSTSYVVLRNVGQTAGSTRGLWMCQRPSYFELPAVDLGPGEAVAVIVGDGELPDLIGISETISAGAALGRLDAEDGEMALYTDAAFSDPAAIIGYVKWGDDPAVGRSDTAVAAGIWTEGGTVDVPTELLVLTAANPPAAGPDDWIAEIGG